MRMFTVGVVASISIILGLLSNMYAHTSYFLQWQLEYALIVLGIFGLLGAMVGGLILPRTHNDSNNPRNVHPKAIGKLFNRMALVIITITIFVVLASFFLTINDDTQNWSFIFVLFIASIVIALMLFVVVITTLYGWYLKIRGDRP